MRMMWEADPDNRPSFKESSVVIKALVTKLSEDIEYSYTISDTADSPMKSPLTRVTSVVQEYHNLCKEDVEAALTEERKDIIDEPYADNTDMFPEIYY